ncbi:MAG: hypothetical protein K6B64_05870 [Acholeplasmatales bacterium]|nr:hypothetical protein [Acholeplasmatales bacterium]
MFLDVAFSPSAYIGGWIVIASIFVAAGLVVALVVVLIVKVIKNKKNKLPKENVNKQQNDEE